MTAHTMLIGAGAGRFRPRFAIAGANWTRSASNPILSPSVAWEETSVTEPFVLYESGTWKMWYTGGWDHPGLGYATSSDGVTWTPYASNPVYGQGGSSYANTSASAEIAKVGSTYYLFTSGGSSTTDARSTFRVATSSDGIAWTTQTSSISLPSGKTLWGNRVVWKESLNWYMLQEAGPTAWEIYLYTALDGLTWTIGNSGNPLTTLQVAASGMYGGPAFAQVEGVVTPTLEGVYHLWYHAASGAGNTPTNLYHSTSTNKTTWTTPELVLTHLGSGDEIDQAADPEPRVVGPLSYLFYDGVDNATERGRILLARYP